MKEFDRKDIRHRRSYKSSFYRQYPEWGYDNSGEEKLPLIDLDDNYKNYNEFIQKFPSGMPDIKELNSLQIRGNIIFDGNMSLRGNVEIKNIEI